MCECVWVEEEEENLRGYLYQQGGEERCGWCMGVKDPIPRRI
jgi:hypothetical protein